MSSRERVVAGGMALVYLAGAGTVLALVHGHRHAAPLVVAALTIALGIAWRVPFEIGSGVAVPNQLVLVPMLFILPLQLVLVMAPLGILLGRLPDFILRRHHPDRWILCLGDQWFILGPILVLGLLAPGPPRASHLPVYALALALEIGLGLTNAVIGELMMYGRPARETARVASWAYLIDAVLTPIAYITAIVAVRSPAATVALVPLLWLLHVFARERKERYNAALELNQAYRGTVMVLSDVVEADDNYTAHHCRSVVELAAAVGRELKLGYDELQELEIVALLHDVGKIAIPKEILNKPARLTDAEFELMKTHTLEGQALLERVGGKLARVGQVVRSCHERWDGQGYPDGLAGSEIPVAARIVFCCDAYSAMTTDRPYRRAMPHEQALAELEAHAGTQFEPRVVDALSRIVIETNGRPAEPYSDALRAVLSSSSPVTAAVELPS